MENIQIWSMHLNLIIYLFFQTKKGPAHIADQLHFQQVCYCPKSRTQTTVSSIHCVFFFFFFAKSVEFFFLLEKV